MDTEINPSSPPSSDSRSRYPWLRLLDLDIKRSTHQARGRGRPPKPFPRRSLHTTLTENEIAVLDKLVDVIAARIGSGVHRSNVIAFMILRMEDLLQSKDGMVSLPETVQSFTDLALFLDQQQITKKETNSPTLE